MNGLEKLELLDSIALKLEARMTFNDINHYFRGHGVFTQNNKDSQNNTVAQPCKSHHF
jgi:hypothetical protein